MKSTIPQIGHEDNRKVQLHRFFMLVFGVHMFRSAVRTKKKSSTAYILMAPRTQARKTSIACSSYHFGKASTVSKNVA